MSLSRRHVLSTAAIGAVGLAHAAAAASPGNPDEPAQGLATTQGNPSAAVDPSPQSPALAGQFPQAFTPPPTDIGDLPQFWASFNNAPRRIQAGGWARQVTQPDFNISESISGVNMRLDAGGVRELHWHLAAEWAFMSYGNCRITVLDPQGRAYVADVKAGDLWYFPAGQMTVFNAGPKAVTNTFNPGDIGYIKRSNGHYVKNIGDTDLVFLEVFNTDTYQSISLSDWLAHSPPEMVAAHFNISPQDLAKFSRDVPDVMPT